MGISIGTVYIALFGIGLVYAVLASFLGWLGDHDFGGHHLDAGGHVDQPSPISGTVLATFVTGFGAGGILAHHVLGWSLLPGLGAATATGLVLAGAAFGVLELLFSRTQAGSEYSSHETVGRSAEVITTIPEGGTGEIAYVVKGQRERAPARASDGQAIAKGTGVVIDRVAGTTAYVHIPEDTA